MKLNLFFLFAVLSISSANACRITYTDAAHGYSSYQDFNFPCKDISLNKPPVIDCQDKIVPPPKGFIYPGKMTAAQLFTKKAPVVK